MHTGLARSGSEGFMLDMTFVVAADQVAQLDVVEIIACALQRELSCQRNLQSVTASSTACLCRDAD